MQTNSNSFPTSLPSFTPIKLPFASPSKPPFSPPTNPPFTKQTKLPFSNIQSVNDTYTQTIKLNMNVPPVQYINTLTQVLKDSFCDQKISILYKSKENIAAQIDCYETYNIIKEEPSNIPNVEPSDVPSLLPSKRPTKQSSFEPSSRATDKPSN